MTDNKNNFIEGFCCAELRAETAEQYMKAVDCAYKLLWDQNKAAAASGYSRKLWFRGLKAHDYPLLPSIGRGNLNAEHEAITLSRFKSWASEYLNQVPVLPSSKGKEAYWDWLFLIHRHGAPTRLLDWTEDALVALVFAVDSDASPQEKEKDAAVWCLNPVELNTAFSFHDYYPKGYIPNIKDKRVYNYFGPDANPLPDKKPAAVYAPGTTSGLVLQRGTFTVFPHAIPFADMRRLPDGNRYLMKIGIAKDFKDKINRQLKSFGIEKAQLMPDLGQYSGKIFKEGFGDESQAKL